MPRISLPPTHTYARVDTACERPDLKNLVLQLLAALVVVLLSPH